MRIKAVCEATGLTDRTVRYYIEEGLLTPEYIENYMGRRTFIFCEEDICRLKDIAVLRKFGFSVAEIRQMLSSPGDTLRIVGARRDRKQARIGEEQALLGQLLRLDPDGTYTVRELAAFLSAPVEDMALPAEDGARNIRAGLVKLGKAAVMLAAVWGPVAAVCAGLVDGLRWYYYPVIDPLGILLTVLMLQPVLMLLVLPRISLPERQMHRFKGILAALCLLSIPVCRFVPVTVFSASETRDFVHYRDFDPECLANRDPLFQALFPQWPRYFDHVRQPDGTLEEVWLDSRYYYRYNNGWDYTYDIIAEWPLEEGEFREEVSRVRELFSQREYVTMEKGPYTCLIVYQGSPPFQPADTSYTYYIFAYDEEALRVRYIYCDSLDDGADQPYYLELDWT